MPYYTTKHCHNAQGVIAYSVTMKLHLPKRHNHDFLAEQHIYVDDLKELTELRDNAKDLDEQLFYSNLINGAQRVLQYLQEETTK